VASAENAGLRLAVPNVVSAGWHKRSQRKLRDGRKLWLSINARRKQIAKPMAFALTADGR